MILQTKQILPFGIFLIVIGCLNSFATATTTTAPSATSAISRKKDELQTLPWTAVFPNMPLLRSVEVLAWERITREFLQSQGVLLEQLTWTRQTLFTSATDEVLEIPWDAPPVWPSNLHMPSSNPWLILIHSLDADQAITTQSNAIALPSPVGTFLLMVEFQTQAWNSDTILSVLIHNWKSYLTLLSTWLDVFEPSLESFLNATATAAVTSNTSNSTSIASVTTEMDSNTTSSSSNHWDLMIWTVPLICLAAVSVVLVYLHTPRHLPPSPAATEITVSNIDGALRTTTESPMFHSATSEVVDSEESDSGWDSTNHDSEDEDFMESSTTNRRKSGI
jgi:hypothetical protein